MAKQQAGDCGQRRLSHAPLETVSRACRLLKAFGDEDEPLSLAELSKLTGIEKTIAFRVVHTLEAEGLLKKTASARYVRPLKMISPKRFRVGYAAQASDSAFSAAVSESLRWAAKNNDIELIELNNQYSAKAALRNAERLISERVDLAIEFQTYERIAPAVSSSFRSAGIPLIAVEIPHPGAVYFGIDNYRAGITAGRALAKAAKQFWRGQFEEILLLELNIAGRVPHLRIAGITAALKETLPTGCPIYNLETRGEFSQAFGMVRKHLLARSPRRTLVAGINDPCVIGALRAFEEAGRSEFCLAVGMGAILEAREELRKRDTRLVCSLAFFPEHYGEALVQLALEMLHQRPVPSSIHTTVQAITSQNIDNFYPADCEVPVCARGLR